MNPLLPAISSVYVLIPPSLPAQSLSAIEPPSLCVQQLVKVGDSYEIETADYFLNQVPKAATGKVNSLVAAGFSRKTPVEPFQVAFVKAAHEKKRCVKMIDLPLAPVPQP